MGGAFAGLPEPVRDWLPIDPVRRVHVEGRWSGSQQLESTQNRGNLFVAQVSVVLVIHSSCY